MDYTDDTISAVSSSPIYSGTELDAMAEARNYYAWILEEFAPYVGKRVIEVGAGIGTFSQFLIDRFPESSFLLLEPAKNLFPSLERRHSGDRRRSNKSWPAEERRKLADRRRIGSGRVCVQQDSLNEFTARESADSIVMINVLEHVADDEELLRHAFRVLSPAGSLLLFVPALPWLYGSLDRALDHCRRYTKAGLTNRLREAGFRLTRLRYVNLPGVIPWFVAGKLLRWNTLKPPHVRLYDRWVIPWWSKVERRWQPFWGQSLLGIAQKQPE